MPRLKLVIAYDGAPWQGWQSQPGDVGVQDQVELAVQAVTSQPRACVHGSGRTDAGVHAIAQVAHFDVTERYTKMRPEQWVRALNTRLPRSIRIMAAEYAAADFHARFGAQAKTYHYRIHRGEVLPPLLVERAWHIYGELEVELLRAAVEKYVGTHNFCRLSANRGDMDEATRRADTAATTRTVFSAEVEALGQEVVVRFRGSGFLYKMVRLMVGAAVQVARGRAELAWIDDLLSVTSGEKNHFCAPADGLYLESVEYGAV